MLAGAFETHDGPLDGDKFAQRGASRLLDLDRPGRWFFKGWISEAPVTYARSGGVAGLLGAFCWLLFRSQPASPSEERVR